MARIPDEEVERIKREVSLVRLVEARGIVLRGSGDNLLGLCPYHPDKKPSLVISPSKNVWNCLGACQAGGSVIDWVMRSEGVSFRHAVELLRNDAVLSKTDKIAKQSTVPKLSAPVDGGVEDKKLLLQVIAYYHQTLKESPEALAYLKTRELVHPELALHFQLGFANRTLGLRLPKTNRQAGAELRGRLQSLGILRDSGHEHFNGSLVVPVFDEDGSVAEIYGRKITPGLRPGTPNHLYLPGPHRGVFNLAGIRGSEDIILCESLIDAMTFWRAGYRYVTASFGIEGFTKAHLEAFKHPKTKRILIAYDRDDAGERAAEKLAPSLAAEGLTIFRILFPKGMDANEYACKMDPPERAFELVLRKMTWMAGTKTASHRETQTIPEPTIAGPGQNASPTVKPLPITKMHSEAIAENRAPNIPGPGQNTSPTVEPPPITESAPRAAVEPNKPEVDIDIAEHEINFHFGDRKIRVRGLDKNKSYDALKVNLFIARSERFFVDTLDLYHARQRTTFLQQAAQELEVPQEILKSDLGKLLLSLEAIQEKAIEESLKPKTPEIVLTPEERESALALLKDENLFDRILSDFETLGIVGEETNKLVGYVATVSRKLDAPLAVILQSSSAAGKSSLMEAVLALVPEEERIKYSAMTGQSLYYLGETDLKHKILAIVEEEGAERASYALKLLQSEGELTIASTGKDPATGQLKTNEYRVEGPVMIFLTTTAIDVDEELLNRCLVLTVDEGREQTSKIQHRQRLGRTLEGRLQKRDRAQRMRLHQNAQRLLRKLVVVNPYAPALSFSDSMTRMRRDHEKYLTLIDAVTLLFQYQREVKTVMHDGECVEYIEVTKQDIALVERLCQGVLGRTLDDLPPQTRRLLEIVEKKIDTVATKTGVSKEDVRLSRRELREETKWSNTQLKVHLDRLVEMEYLSLHRGPHSQRFLYGLCTAPLSSNPFSAKPSVFVERPANNRNRTAENPNRTAQNTHRSGGCRGQNRPVSVMESGAKTITSLASSQTGRPVSERTSGPQKNGVSYAKPSRTAKPENRS